MWGNDPNTNTSGMPPAERGLRGWICVYRSVLAGRGREPVQNNGTRVECGTAGNILSQTQGDPGLWGGALCGRTLSTPFSHQVNDSKRRSVLSNMDACNCFFVFCFFKFSSFHFTPKLNWKTMSHGISLKPVTHSLKISIQMCEPQLWRCWSHSEYEVLVFLFRLCIRPDATHLRPHASHDPAPVYRGQNPSPSCKQADKDNLIDVGAAQR